MTPLSELIQQIREALEADEIAVQDYKETARRYFEQYEAAKARILRCKNFISNRMRESALQEARTEPNLRDLCSELHFKELLKWKKLCEEKKWPIPDIYESQFNAVLQDIFAANNKLESLLIDFRRAAIKNDFRKCVLMLRDIIKLDWSNKIWEEDLKEFEKSRMSEIRNEFSSAIKNNDNNYIPYLFMEMEEKWSIPRDELLYSEIQQHLFNIERQEAIKKGKILINRMIIAYEKNDLRVVEEAIKEYEILRKNKHFDNPSMDQKYLKISSRVEKIKKKETQKKADDRESEQWDEGISLLESSLKQGTRKKITACLKYLKSFSGRTIPQELEAETALKIRKLDFRQKIIAGLITSVLLIVVGIFFTLNRYQQIKQSTTAALESAFNIDDLPLFLSILQETEKNHIFVYKSDEIQDWASKVPIITSAVEKKGVIFDDAIIQLQQIQGEGFYESEAVVEQLLHTAEINALTGEGKGKVDSIKNAWKIHKDLLVSQNDKNLNELLNIISNKIKDIELALTNFQLGTANGYIPEIDILFIKAAELNNASPKMLDEMEKFKLKFQNIKSDLQPKIRQLETISKASNLADYITELKTYVTALPDDPLSKFMNVIISNEAFYYSLLWMLSNNPEDRFWYPSKKIINTISSNLPKVKNDIEKLQNYKWFTDISEYSLSSNSNKKIIIEGDSLPTDYNNDGVLCYSGSVYIPSSEDAEPEFTQKEIPTYLINPGSLRKMEHCRVLNKLFNNILSAPSDVFCETLLKQMRILLNEQISPILKAYVIEDLVRALINLMGENALPEWNKALSDLSGFKSPIHWLCIQNTEIKKYNSDAQTILDQHFNKTNLISLQNANLNLIRQALKRQAKWVGNISLDGKNEIQWKESTIPNEIWVLRASDNPKIFIAQELKDKEMKNASDFIGYLPGEPIFAPDDTRTSREILKEIFSENKLSNDNQIYGPPLWPANLTTP